MSVGNVLRDYQPGPRTTVDAGVSQIAAPSMRASSFERLNEAANQISAFDAPKGKRMSQGASHYPVSQLIARIMSDSEFSRLQFVTALGYRNIERGLRAPGPVAR
jgi:hypothetical protein